MENIIKIFDNFKISKYAMYTADEPMIPYLQKELGCKVLIYGAGNAGHAAVKYASDNLNICADYVVDISPTVNYIDKVPVISLLDFIQRQNKKKEKYLALIATSSFTHNSDERIDIIQSLMGNGVIKLIDLMRNLESIIKLDWFRYIINHKERFIYNYGIFEDEVSKDVYSSYISALLEGHEYRGPENCEEDKYFGTGDSTWIYKQDDHECWINFGSYRGDTIYHYINSGARFEKIYAVEGDKSILGTLKRNLGYLKDDVRSKIEIIDTYFGAAKNQIRIDDYFENKKVTLMNMDIEGAEVGALKSAEKVIKKNRPVLAVCVYHKVDDLLTIPQIITNIENDYKFFLRKYPSLPGKYHNGIFRLNELVLYAVPKDRL